MDAGSPRRELTGQFGWETCPEPMRNLVLKIVKNYRSILGTNLTGVYLHGSLAMSCFNPQRSDIDFLAIVGEPLSVEEKRLIIGLLLDIRGVTSPKGIEMSIVLGKYLRDYVFPTPYELHYSPGWDERYRNGEVDFSDNRTDEDLVAHAMITRERGITLYGKPVKEVFSDVPQELYRKSILADARWILERLKTEDPVYIVLNFCRILAYFRDGKITSKKEGGQWGLGNLPDRFKPLVSAALGIYTGEKSEQDMDTSSLDAFIRYMTEEPGLA